METATEFRNGPPHGNFAILAPAYQGDEQPTELQQLSLRMEYSPMISAEYDPALLGLDSVEPPYPIIPNQDKNQAWKLFGYSKVREMTHRNTEKQLSSVTYSDLNVSFSYDLQHEGQLIMIPFWYIRYAYRNVLYYYTMDGLGKLHSENTPLNELEKKFLKSKSTQTNVICWLSLLLPPLAWYLINIDAALITFILWIIMTIIL